MREAEIAWFDIFKLWAAATSPNPISRRERLKGVEGAGVTSPDVLPDIRGDGTFGGGGRGSVIRLRDSTDFIDLSSTTNRQSRYKEYERLRLVPEIETALTVFAEESCVAGWTPVMTPFGPIPISKLAEVKKPDEMFLVYTYDFSKDDISLGWAFHPRKTGTQETVQVTLDDGSMLTCTSDHRILLRSGGWRTAGELKPDDELMPFHRVRLGSSESEEKQFPRVFTFSDGWKSERAMLDEFRTGKKSVHAERVDTIMRCIARGLDTKQISQYMKKAWPTLLEHLQAEGLSYKRVKRINEQHSDRKRVVCVDAGPTIDVYDLSVKGTENFCTDSAIVHNCQKGEEGHLFEIKCKNSDIKEELEFLFFHQKMLNVDRQLYHWAKNLYVFGDHFVELVIDPEEPKAGVLKTQVLPPDSMYRIETIKGKVLEFQQSKSGPDYEALARIDVTQSTDLELMASNAIRFAPDQIVHFRIGDERRQFYPYGVSLIEPARGPAQSLRLMEDAMVVYRLSRAAERRVFYIDIGNLPPFKADMVLERVKDQLRKRKTVNQRGGPGAGGVDERNSPPDMEEDIWIPTRPNSNTRVETLPGAQNLGEIDDALYFRNKLFIALNFPKSYFAEEDTQVTRVTLSSVNAKFAKQVERLQQSLADGLTEIAFRHLELRGFPSSLYDDLQLVMTVPFPYRELALNEITEIKYQRAMAMKGSGLFSDYDIFTRIMGMNEDDAKQIVARAYGQKLQEVRLNLIAANPELAGAVGKQPAGTEMGTDAAGPAPALTGQEGAPPPPGGEGGAPPGGEPMVAPLSPEQMKATSGREAADTYGQSPRHEAQPLPDPTPDEIEEYDLEIYDSSQEIDEEEVDVSELEDE